MADNQEQVVYSFEGDISSLREATQQAISMLDKYDSAIKKMASSDAFKASKTSAAGFQRVTSGLVKQVNTLTSALNSTGTAIESAMPDATATVVNATQSLADVLSYLDQTTSVSSGDLKFLTEVLKESKEAMDPIISRATLLTSSLKSLEQLNPAQPMQEASAATEAASRSFGKVADWGFKVQDAYVASGKAAADSAISFLKAERAATRVTNIQTLMQRLRTEMNIFRAYAAKAWRGFSEQISPVTSKLQSFKDKATQSLGKVKSVLNQVSSAFRRTATEADSSGDSLESLAVESSTLGSVLQGLSRATKKSSSQFSVFSKITNALKRAFAGLIGINIGRWLSNAANESIEFAENLNLFTVAVGDAYEASYAFIQQMQELYGMDPSNLLRYTGYFYQLADAISMPAQASSNLSLSLTKAANDIASLFNVDIETVVEDLASGMQGMSRAVRKYGMDIRTVTLQQTAYSLGITDSVENMSEANRMGLRFITMMRQAENAAGDFANTIEQPANQLRVFKEQMSQLGRAIGNLFIKPLTTALQYINGFVMALRVAITYISSLLGVVEDVTSNVNTDDTDEIAESVEDIENAANDASKAIKKLLGPFDELNVLSEQDNDMSDLGTLDPAIQQAIADMELSLENIRMKANDVRDALLKFFGFKVDEGAILSWSSEDFEKNLIAKFPQWTSEIQAAFDNWAGIVDGFKAVFNSLADVAEAMWTRISGLLGKLGIDVNMTEIIENLAGNLEKLAAFISSNSAVIADFVLVLTALGAGFKALQAIATKLAPVINVIMQFSGAFTGLGSTVAIVAAVVAAIALLYFNSEQFASSFNNLLGSLVAGFKEMFTSLAKSLKKIGSSLTRTWSKSIKPFLDKLGSALAPVIDTLVSVWGNLVSIISATFSVIADLWVSTIEPVLNALFKALGAVAQIFQTLWSSIVGPIIESIGDSIEKLWNSHLMPVISKVIEIVGTLIEIILNLWTHVLAPLIDFLVAAFGPRFAAVFDAIWTGTSAIIGNIVDVIGGLLTVLDGVLDFIAGVFAGDWQRAWEGIVNIFKGVWQILVSVVKVVFNSVLGAINVVLGSISGAINGIVQAVNKLSFDVPDWVPGFGGSTFGFNLPEVGTWQVPYLATGAVATGPTMAMIGEGRYDEAVIPLGNSPQMRDFVGSVVDGVNNSEQTYLLREQNDLLRQILEKTGTTLDGKSLNDALHTYQRNRARGRGV